MTKPDDMRSAGATSGTGSIPALGAASGQPASGQESVAVSTAEPADVGMLIFAHRGARAHAPENTLLAFNVAFEVGADAIECDVQLSADGALVIIHDEKLNRTTNGRGPVSARTLAELRALDAGRGEHIPTLSEVLDLCRGRGRSVNLELKAETVDAALAVAAAMERVLSVLDESARRLVLVSSFKLPALAQLKARLPWLRAATLHGGREWRRRDLCAPALEMGAEAVHPGINLVSPQVVRDAHARGLRVHVWTANRWSTLSRLLAWGVDGVFTDYPERAVITRVMRGATSEPVDEAQDEPHGRRA
jgi:glycerophosphoryl diester phosphodiesterase